MVVGLFRRAFARRCARAIMSVISDIDASCLIVHGWSSTIRHSQGQSTLSYDWRMDMRERIEMVLREKGRSVRGTSIAAGMGETTLRNYLKGMTQSLTIDSAEKLAAEMGVSAHWLIFGEEPKTEQPPETAEVIRFMSFMDLGRRQTARDIIKRLADEEEHVSQKDNAG